MLLSCARPGGRAQGPGRPKDMEKRGAILAAAQKLFTRSGFEWTSMDAIAQAAAVCKHRHCAAAEQSRCCTCMPDECSAGGHPAILTVVSCAATDWPDARLGVCDEIRCTLRARRMSSRCMVRADPAEARLRNSHVNQRANRARPRHAPPACCRAAHGRRIPRSSASIHALHARCAHGQTWLHGVGAACGNAGVVMRASSNTVL